MNCDCVRNKLACLIYGDMPADEAAAIEKHLAECANCRHERQALIRAKGALDLLPASSPEINMASFYRRLANEQNRRARLWRRAALAVASAAAVLIAIFGMSRLEFQVDRGHAVIRWGPSSPVPDSDTRPPAAIQTTALPASQESTRLAALEQRLRLVSELIHALAENVESLDQREHEDAARIDVRLQGMQQITSQRWSDVVQVVNTLKTTLRKGES
jgi:hypothetical protein